MRETRRGLTAHISATDGTAGDRSDIAMAVDGDTVVVGAWYGDGAAVNFWLLQSV